MRTLLAILLVLLCEQTGLSQEAADHSPASADAPSTNVSVTASTAPEPNSPATLVPAATDLAAADIPQYCSDLAASQEHSSSLAAVCQFVFSLRKTLTNIICDRETKRYWSSRESETVHFKHSDVVTVQVTYRDGQEFYSDARVDGQPVSANGSEPSRYWSHGEFVTFLASIFAPSSKAQFHYAKQTHLHSIRAFVFDFNVAAQNNRFYFLQSGNKTWFPEYKGEIWVDARTSSLLRMELETAHVRDYPIRRTKDEIEYSDLLLGDGTSMVLPTNSNVLICGKTCARSVIKFTNWHKFRATTNIVMTPAN